MVFLYAILTCAADDSRDDIAVVEIEVSVDWFCGFPCGSDEGCTADSETICLPVQYMHSSKAPFIGQAYYVQFLDTKGTVIVDGHPITLADGNRNTVRD